MKKYKKWLIFLPILWYGVIWNFSSKPGNISSSQSNSVSKYLNKFPLNLIFSVIPLRKCAHIFLFFILFITVYIAFREISKHYLWSIVITYIFACIDEFHQLFVPNRGASFKDTLVDLSGILIGFIFVLSARFAYSYIAKRKEKRSQN